MSLPRQEQAKIPTKQPGLLSRVTGDGVILMDYAGRYVTQNQIPVRVYASASDFFKCRFDYGTAAARVELGQEVQSKASGSAKDVRRELNVAVKKRPRS